MRLRDIDWSADNQHLRSSGIERAHVYLPKIGALTLYRGWKPATDERWYHILSTYPWQDWTIQPAHYENVSALIAQAVLYHYTSLVTPEGNDGRT
jgi:hypothetical protein